MSRARVSRPLPANIVLRPAARRLAGFDFTAQMRRLSEEMVARTPSLAHVDLSRVAVCFCQARRNVSHGLFASLTPLRFAGGSPTVVRRGRPYGVQKLSDESGREMLYILSFYLPRFMNLDLREKLITVFHELWHIGPRFDGDIRRHEGRCFAHTSSQAEYDEEMGRLVDAWLASSPDEAIWEFLRGDFRSLVRNHGQVYGLKVPRPRLLPLGAALRQ